MALGKVENEKYKFEIHLDSTGLGDPRDPKPTWTTLVCGHRRYDRLGDINIDSSQFNGWNEVLDYYMDDPEHVFAIVHPVSLLDHSGLRFFLGRRNGWDSGQVGWIFVEGEDVVRYALQHNFKTVADAKEELEKRVKQEVHEYDLWVWGSVYEAALYEKNKCEDCGHVEVEHVTTLGGIIADSISEIIDEFESYAGSLEDYGLDIENYEELR